MTDITSILGGPWSPPPERIADPPETQLYDAMREAGLEPPDQIYMDGKIHRFRSGTKGTGKGGDKPGWYVVFGDGIPAGRFGCWRAGVEITWRADVGRKLTPTEEMAHARRMAEAKTARDAERERQYEVASATVETIWQQAQAAHPDHPYLTRKGIGVNGARVTGDGRLVVPLYSPDGTLSSLQYITHDGGKMNHPGAQTGGKYWMLGTLDEPGTLYIAEGFATAATIHETSRRPCVIAYSASNLVPVTSTLRERYGASQELVIVADNDNSGTGKQYADQAAAQTGARVVMPDIHGDANDYVRAGRDLNELLTPPNRDWLIPADEFCEQSAPLSWMVKHWVQDNALMMVHGPSGGGKTFIVLDWCLRIASGMQEWCGHKVREGSVVYLAGEGHHGMRGRIAAWKTQHNPGPLAMWISKDGTDLNTPAGYLKVIDSIRALPSTPRLIVVDTLHRFLSGDENSAQDTKTMLDACNSLMRELKCSVILVHHTGVAEEAQHRARGSSAWRGALDIEISIVPGKEGTPMQIIQRKSKDAELAKPLHVELKTVEIPEWEDEDGQPVSSAVVIEADAPPERVKDTPAMKNRDIWEAAWWKAGAQIKDNQPYLSQQALIDYLVTDHKKSLEWAKKSTRDGEPNRLIWYLLQANIIQSVSGDEKGWIVIEEKHASSLRMSRNGQKACE